MASINVASASVSVSFCDLITLFHWNASYAQLAKKNKNAIRDFIRTEEAVTYRPKTERRVES